MKLLKNLSAELLKYNRLNEKSILQINELIYNIEKIIHTNINLQKFDPNC